MKRSSAPGSVLETVGFGVSVLWLRLLGALRRTASPSMGFVFALLVLPVMAHAQSCTTFRTATIGGPYSSPAELCEADRLARGGVTVIVTPAMTPQSANCRTYKADGTQTTTTIQKSCDGSSLLWPEYLAWADANPPGSLAAMDWGSAAHLMQAMWWGFLFLLFVAGIRQGDRLV